MNPYMMYTISWMIVIPLYYLNWSSLYPRLKLSLLLFYIFTGIIAWLLSLKYGNTERLKLTKLSRPKRFKGLFKKYLIFNYILLVLEFILNGGIPIFMYSAGEIIAENDYMKFGIPIVRVFVINSFSVISVFSAYCIVSCKGKKKSFWILSMFLSMLPPIICVQRGIFINQLFGCFVIYCMFRKISTMNIVRFSILSIVVLWTFGTIGNMRSAKGDETYMNRLWGANKNFEETGIPSPFFWAYIYATSPLANLQKAVDKKEIGIDNYNVRDFIVSDIVPQIVSKNIKVKDEAHKYYVYPNLVVCTTFIHSYLYLGWLGMIVMFLYIMLFVTIVIRCVRVCSPFRIPLIVCLCEIVFFGIFDNMVHYMGMLPQIAVYMILSWYTKQNKNLNSVSSVLHLMLLKRLTIQSKVF